VGIAFELPGTILGGLLVGYLLDKYLGTSPWFLIAVTAIAFAGAFARLVQWVRFFAGERDGKRVQKNDTAH
jgi:F0F1-type ATP synthase assembly protein I